MYGSLYWRLIALECAHLKGLLVLHRMLSQDMSEVISYPPVSLNSQQPSTHQTHHYATATSADCRKTQSWALCPLFVSHRALLSIASFRPNTGTPMWMRWKELLQIIKERLSTDSSGSGTKPFSVETRHQPPASGEQVWLFSLRVLLQWCLTDIICDALGDILFINVDAMPVDHEQYYGFTKFAIELNELDPSLKLLLPPTDTRLRVDQRYERIKWKEPINVY